MVLCRSLCPILFNRVIQLWKYTSIISHSVNQSFMIPIDGRVERNNRRGIILEVDEDHRHDYQCAEAKEARDPGPLDITPHG